MRTKQRQRKKTNEPKTYLIEGVRTKLPQGITRELKNGIEYRLAVRWHTPEGNRKKIFPYTIDGLSVAKSWLDDKKEELQKFGTDFRNITDNEKRAIDLLREWQKEVKKNGFTLLSAYEVMKKGLDDLQKNSPTFGQMAREYLQKLAAKKDGKVDEYYMTTLHRLDKIKMSIGNKPLHTITPDDLNAFIETLTDKRGHLAAPNTRKQYGNLIKSVFKMAVDKRLIEPSQNASLSLTVPKIVLDEPSILTVEQVRMIFDFLKTHKNFHKFIPITSLGIFCGIRTLERMRIRFADLFVGGRNEIFLSKTITKTGQARYIYPPKCVKEWIDFCKKKRLLMKPDSFLIDGETEQKRKDNYNRFLATLSDELGFSIPRNAFRHTAASYMAELQGYTKTALQLGHNESILLKHYRRAISQHEAMAFFEIVP